MKERGVVFILIRRADYTWLLHHAEKDKEGVWRCKETHVEIKFQEIGRSIHRRGFTEFFKDIRYVAHAYCLPCMPVPVFPKEGASVYREELVEIE